MALTLDVRTQLEHSQPMIKRNKEVMSATDWSSIEQRKNIKNIYSTHTKISEHALDTAEVIIEMAGDQVSNKEVQKMLKDCAGIFDLHYDRFKKYYDKNIDSSNPADITFQLDMDAELSKLKIKRNSLNFGGEVNTVSSNSRKGTAPVSLAQKPNFEKDNPDVIEYIESRREKEANG